MDKNTLELQVINNNRKNILLNYLREKGATPRIDLATAMGLTKSAITNIVNELIEQNILIEKGESITPENKYKRGRRKVLIDINENYKFIFGISIIDDEIKIALTNLKGDTLDKTECFLVGKSYRQILELIVEKVNNINNNNQLTKNNILGVGICINKSATKYIEGNTDKDKLNKLKKDLKYAFPFNVTASCFIDGVLLGQRIFSSYRSIINAIAIRHDISIDFGVIINGIPYHGQNSNNFSVYKSNQSEMVTYHDFLKKTMTEEQFFDEIAKDINTVNTILSPQKIFVLGEMYENDYIYNNIVGQFESKYKIKNFIVRSYINEDNSYLSGAAIAISKYFYNM